MSVCLGCKKAIVWGLTPDGKKIPLDPKPPVYQVGQLDTGVVTALRVSQEVPAPREFPDCYMVSHFSTCPNANQFSGSN